MLLNCGVGEDCWESLGLQGDPTCPSQRKLVLNIHWKDWCWCWSSNTLATWCEELTHLKRPWCWERLRAGGEGDDRGWDGWIASPTQWTWVWVNSGSWRWKGRPDMLQSMGVAKSWTQLSDWTELLEWSSDVNQTSQGRKLTYGRKINLKFTLSTIIVYGFPLNHSNVLKELIFLPSYHMAKPIEYCKVKYNKIKKKSYDSLKTWRAHFNPQTPIFSELKSTML